MTFEFELDYSKATWTWPLESSAVIIDIRGCIYNFLTELVPHGRHHFVCLKSDIPIQVSSTLIMIFLLISILKKAKANY